MATRVRTVIVARIGSENYCMASIVYALRLKYDEFPERIATKTSPNDLNIRMNSSCVYGTDALSFVFSLDTSIGVTCEVRRAELSRSFNSATASAKKSIVRKGDRLSTVLMRDGRLILPFLPAQLRLRIILVSG